ncbi:MAG: DUF488 family protein [Planctomycetota bacterium]|nr:MAG: DUF488 family protein [Planctomycetota bacterium]REJ87291.1 MAG: DUF488 family protein [Planctomycetota bacterium]REK27886.1 MAG: DUF488 family protein [Planctomycetota bacterium]REK32803.1 MAG: DUF488 family protein [Planctomycetota bacterium]
MATEFRVKRIYEEPSADDGVRLLVDRLWPRGVSKEASKIDLWAKELTPSHELRKWFHDHPDQHADFAERYRIELQERFADITGLFASLETSPVTLVTSTKDLDHGHVAVLKCFLADHLD